MNRSFLFVPADDEHKLQKAGEAGADALILDLEDSVVAAARTVARDLARAYIAGKKNVWVVPLLLRHLSQALDEFKTKCGFQGGRNLNQVRHGPESQSLRTITAKRPKSQSISLRGSRRLSPSGSMRTILRIRLSRSSK